MVVNVSVQLLESPEICASKHDSAREVELNRGATIF